MFDFLLTSSILKGIHEGASDTLRKYNKIVYVQVEVNFDHEHSIMVNCAPMIVFDAHEKSYFRLKRITEGQ